MYSRNFTRDRSTPPPPPSYSGVMYPREEESLEQSAPSPQKDSPLERTAPEKEGERDGGEKKPSGALLAGSLTFEDLLLIGLILILLDSGADDELLLLLAFLLLAGR